MTYNHIESAMIHGGIYGDEKTGAVNTPIFQTATYAQPELGRHTGYEYSRTGNPTRAALEALIAELEGGTAGFAFASGMAAITAVIGLLNSGDGVIISSSVYGGTFRVLDQVFKRFGIFYQIVDTRDLSLVEAAITSEIKAILIETPNNPLLEVTDIAGIAEIAKAHDLLLIVDNTFMTPYLQRPLDLGADIVIHSATKYLGGHSDLIAGLVVVKDPELAKRLHFIQNATGGILQPFDSFLIIRSLKTLGVRMDRHVENADIIAKHLHEHPAVRRVFYPGLPDDPNYALNKTQAKNGGAMISFELSDNIDMAKFFGSLELIALAESLGGVESLICHPASMTHASIPAETRLSVGITDELIRLSVGIEHVDDLVADLDQAIARAQRAT